MIRHWNMMNSRPVRVALLTLIVALLQSRGAARAQTDCEADDWPGLPAWREPYPAHRVIGPLYAVGNAGLGVFFIATDAGHILINSGLEDSLPWIRQNIESLGYRLEDVRILLTMQSHFDHTAALAEIKAVSGAQMWATAADARVLEGGGASDPRYGHCRYARFHPVAVDRVIADGEVIDLGGVAVTVLEHPGHTVGSASYALTVHENDRDYRVLIANLGTINPGMRLVVEPTYPGVAKDFAATYRKQKALDVDVWVAAHPGQYGLSRKHSPGQAYDPDAFVDPDGFLAAVERLEEIYLEQIHNERRAE